MENYIFGKTADMRDFVLNEMVYIFSMCAPHVELNMSLTRAYLEDLFKFWKKEFKDGRRPDRGCMMAKYYSRTMVRHWDDGYRFQKDSNGKEINGKRVKDVEKAIVE